MHHSCSKPVFDKFKFAKRSFSGAVADHKHLINSKSCLYNGKRVLYTFVNDQFTKKISWGKVADFSILE